MSIADPSDQKARIRRAALERRASVGEASREAFAERLAIEGVAIARRALVRTVAAFWPVGSEPDTLMLMAALDYHDFVAALPVTGAQGEPLTFRRWRQGQPLVEGPMRIPEPAPRLPLVVPDLLFVPTAAFDRRGYRVGYGGGFYDVTLAALRAYRAAPAIGIAYACQEVEAIPEEDHDQPLDFVLTESELIDCSLAWRGDT
ncbi:MAG: 5-formyltetrahydrofolate cyclo-ligase [Beijerinckiaceae bacterium]|nr:5-formyltetrahydrofolate cyclo-ligase [Beijerinckiaceae bacterium]